MAALQAAVLSLLLPHPSRAFSTISFRFGFQL
jgi:hypothetical protein